MGDFFVRVEKKILRVQKKCPFSIDFMLTTTQKNVKIVNCLKSSIMSHQSKYESIV